MSLMTDKIRDVWQPFFFFKEIIYWYIVSVYIEKFMWNLDIQTKVLLKENISITIRVLWCHIFMIKEFIYGRVGGDCFFFLFSSFIFGKDC